MMHLYEPVAVLCYNRQLDDMVRFLMHHHSQSWELTLHSTLVILMSLPLPFVIHCLSTALLAIHLQIFVPHHQWLGNSCMTFFGEQQLMCMKLGWLLQHQPKSLMEACREVWDGRECQANQNHGPSFFQWFTTHKAMEIGDSMLHSVREEAGLGSPPSAFYTNIC